MQAVILCGLQGAGKTTLYRDRFLATHVRISLDLLRTRAREAGFAVVGYLVEEDFSRAAGRNAAREGRARIAESGLRDVARRFVRPAPEEGFGELWHATAAADGGWRIEPLATTPPLF